MDKHPFVAMPEGGNCGAPNCGKANINKIHDWTSADVPMLAPIATRLRTLLRTGSDITQLTVVGDRELEVAFYLGSLDEVLQTISAAAGILRAHFRWEATSPVSQIVRTIRVIIT